VRLSAKGAEVRADAAPPPPLSNLKIWITGLTVGAEGAELYAKVVEGAPAVGAGFVVRFTSVAPEVTAELRKRV
jgi:hypothetical protein